MTKRMSGHRLEPSIRSVTLPEGGAMIDAADVACVAARRLLLALRASLATDWFATAFILADQYIIPVKT